jgi:TRAP-type mannitol/chloroaromatic compound transport system substrate-binding protein
LWEEAYAKAGVQPLLAGTTGPQAGGWFKKEIKNVDDLIGLKMRVGGMGRDVLTRLDSFVSYRLAAARYAEVSDLAQHQARQQVLS